MDNRFDDAAEQFIETRLVEPLLHGDEKHREWLTIELRKWIYDLGDEIQFWYEEGKDVAVRADRTAKTVA